MATLDLSDPESLRLTLRGADENAILTTLRRWSYWQGAEVERDPATARLISVTLVTNRGQEATLREILWRSFELAFPIEGGNQLPPGAKAPKIMRGG
jgi:hypothetical protein